MFKFEKNNKEYICNQAQINVNEVAFVCTPTKNPIKNKESFENIINLSAMKGFHVWYDAADPLGNGSKPANGAQISSWVDKSPNKINMAGTGNPTVVPNSLNSLPGIQINAPGASFFSTGIPAGTYNSGITSFAVYKNLGGVQYNTIVSRNRNGSNLPQPMDVYNDGRLWASGPGSYGGRGGGANLFQTNPAIFTYNLGAKNLATYLNGKNDFNGDGFDTADVGDTLWIGTRGDKVTGFNGIVYEVIVFIGPLNDNDRQSVEGYLASKWGINNQLPQNHPYYSQKINLQSNSSAPDSYLPLLTDAKDVGKNAQESAVRGGTRFVVVGDRKTALFNNDMGTFVQLANRTNNVFTVMYWAFRADAGYYTQVSITDGNNPVLQFDIQQQSLIAYSALPNPWVHNGWSRTAVPVGAWYHVAYTVNNNSASLYINGNLDNSFNGGAPMNSASRPFWFIGRSGDSGRAYNGAIRQFAVWNSVLDQSAISNFMQGTRDDVVFQNKLPMKIDIRKDFNINTSIPQVNGGRGDTNFPNIPDFNSCMLAARNKYPTGDIGVTYLNGNAGTCWAVPMKADGPGSNPGNANWVSAFIPDGVSADNSGIVKFVRVDGGGDYLQISQLVVTDQTGTNIAKGRKATSSGVGWDGPESNAVDGVEASRGHPGEYHSSGGSAWFQVELTSPSQIVSVTIYNRADCCQGRLATGYRIKLLDSAGNNVFTSEPLNAEAKQVITITGPAAAKPKPPIFSKINCDNGETQAGFSCYPTWLANSNYIFTQGMDSGGNDIRRSGNADNVNELKKECDADPNCAGFNTNGFLKNKLNPVNTWSKWTDDPNKGFYVKNQ